MYVSAVNPIAVSIHGAQIVFLKYHFPVKEFREMAISRFEVGNSLEYFVTLNSEKAIRDHQGHVKNTLEPT